MSKVTKLQMQKKKIISVLIEPLISSLHNIQSKIDNSAGAAAVLELRLRIIAQLESEVQDELATKTSKSFYEATLNNIIEAVLKVFQNELDSTDQNIIRNCRVPRNKLIHASFVEFMIKINGEALGREIDPRTGKPKASRRR